MVTALCWLFWAPRYKMGPQWNTWIEWISVTLCSVWEGKRYQSPFKLLCPGLRSSGISKWSMSLMQSQKLKLWQSILPPSDQRFGLGIASCLSWVQDSIKKKKEPARDPSDWGMSLEAWSTLSPEMIAHRLQLLPQHLESPWFFLSESASSQLGEWKTATGKWSSTIVGP